MKNLSLLFNKTYYEELGTPEFSKSLKSINRSILDCEFRNERDYKACEVANRTFLLKTAYPGLIVGTGIPHGSNQSEDDVNLGFSFDYVTGQPFIPASSVKGALRVHFENHPELIAEMLNVDGNEVTALTREIFDSSDVFLDAVVYDSDENGRIIGSDNVTPHVSPTKNPKPLSLIKILPGVRMEFRFRLCNGLVSADAKANLFKELLMLFGIGAKTNVGYGILHQCDCTLTPKADSKPKTTSYAQNGSKKDFKICPHCRTKNYKYMMRDGVVTDTVNWNWEKNVCRNRECRKDLS